MNDNPEGLAYITCLYDDGRAEQCGAMVEDTDDARRAHRAWHANDKTVKDALRSAIGRKDAKISELERLLSAQSTEFGQRLEDMKRDLSRIVVPAPVLPVKRSESGWSDDDEPEVPPTIDDLLPPEEAPSEELQAAREHAEAAFGTVADATPQIDTSGLYQGAIDRSADPAPYSPYPTIPSV